MFSRTIAPAIHQTSRATLPRTAVFSLTRRFINKVATPLLYTAHAKVTGGRVAGHIKSDNLDIGLAMPPEVSGSEGAGKTNPEELFAALFAASYQSAMRAAAPSLNIEMPTDPDDTVIDISVHLHRAPETSDLRLNVEMDIKVRGLEKETIDKLVEQGRKLCPYSRLTLGKIWVTHTTSTLE